MKSRFGSPRGRAAALAAAVVGILAVNAAPALAVSCGDVITTSIRLDQDLNCPASTGLIIGAAGVTIDLHNHTITGGPGFAGIQSDNFHNNMTVTDGTIEGFGGAVDLTGNGTEVSRVRAINNVVTGITLVGANQLITRNVVAGGSNAGIFAVNLADSVISRNRVRGFVR